MQEDPVRITRKICASTYVAAFPCLTRSLYTVDLAYAVHRKHLMEVWIAKFSAHIMGTSHLLNQSKNGRFTRWSFHRFVKLSNASWKSSLQSWKIDVQCYLVWILFVMLSKGRTFLKSIKFHDSGMKILECKPGPKEWLSISYVWSSLQMALPTGRWVFGSKWLSHVVFSPWSVHSWHSSSRVTWMISWKHRFLLYQKVQFRYLATSRKPEGKKRVAQNLISATWPRAENPVFANFWLWDLDVLRYTTWHFSLFSEFEAGCERLMARWSEGLKLRAPKRSTAKVFTCKELLAQAPQALAEQAW